MHNRNDSGERGTRVVCGRDVATAPVVTRTNELTDEGRQLGDS